MDELCHYFIIFHVSDCNLYSVILRNYIKLLPYSFLRSPESCASRGSPPLAFPAQRSGRTCTRGRGEVRVTDPGILVGSGLYNEAWLWTRYINSGDWDLLIKGTQGYILLCEILWCWCKGGGGISKWCLLYYHPVFSRVRSGSGKSPESLYILVAVYLFLYKWYRFM